MADVTQTPDQLPELAAVSSQALAIVWEPGGPTSKIPIERLLGRLISTQEATETQAELQALLDYPVNSIALVFGDADPGANGWYRKAGAAGAGSWVQFEQLSGAVTAEAVAQAQAAQASANQAKGVATFLSSSAAPFANDRRYNQARPANARSGYVDNGAGDLQAAPDWNTFTIAVVAGDKVTLSHHLSSTTGYIFRDSSGAQVGNLQIGDGPAGNALTFVPGGYQIQVPAGTAAFMEFSVPAYYIQPVTDTNLVFLPRFVILNGTVTLGAAALYDPAASPGMKRWAGRKAFVQGDSFWHNRAWPFYLARDLGWASMVRAFRGGRQMSQGLTRAVNSVAQATTAVDTGATDVGITAADVAGVDVFVLALGTNDAAAGVQVGTYTDAPATIDVNGAMTSGGATLFSRARGVIETLVGWNPRMEVVLGTPIYRVGVPLIADYQTAIETLADMYGCTLAQIHRKLGVNLITASTLLADGTHMADADFTLRMKPAWQDAFERVSPVEIVS